MATMIGLMNQFKESFKGKAEGVCGGSNQTRNPTQQKAKDDLLGSFLDDRVKEGVKWAKEEDDSRTRLIHRIMRTKPSDDDIKEYKEAFTKNHKHALEQLQNQHARQLNQLELWLKARVPAGFSDEQSKNLIQAWKTAQAEQIDELEKRHQDDQKRLTNFNRHHDQMVASRKILRAARSAGDKDKDKKNKRIVQDYHFSPFAFIRKKIKKDEVDYDTAGELDIKYAEKFNLYEATTGTKEKEEKEESSLSKKLKKRNEEEEWTITRGDTKGDWEVLFDNTRFSQQSEHVYTNLGTSLFGGIGPFKEEIVVKLHQSVPADKKTGHPAAEGVISTVCYKSDSTEKKRIYLGILANEAMAQGWTSVNLGRLPADMQEEAYIAFRRAGFSHDQLEINGLSFSPEAEGKGQAARDKIEAIYEKKAAKEIEKLGELTALTFQTSEVDEKLKPAVFFTLSGNDRKDLFSKPSPVEYYKRHIAILSEASISPQILGECINAVANSSTKVDLLFNMSTTPGMEWDKFTAVFNAIETDDEKVAVFRGLFKKLEKKADDEQITQALCAILRDCPTKLFAKLLKGLDSKEDVPNRKAIHLLRRGLEKDDLSAQKVYEIYKALNLDTGVLVPSLFKENSYPWEKTSKDTIKFMAAIIVGMFSENKTDRAFTLLNTWMGSSHQDSQLDLMKEIYRTLPSNLRIEPPREKPVEEGNDVAQMVNLDDSEEEEDENPLRDSFDSALQKWIGRKQKELIVSERLSPTYAQAVRNNANPDPNPADLKEGLDPKSNFEVNLKDFYTVPTKQVAHVLREVNAVSRAATLVALCATTDNEKKKQLTQIILELGPKAFADAINAMDSWDKRNNLLSLLAKDEKNRPFLADTVGFLFARNPNFEFEKLQISVADGAPAGPILPVLLPHIHYPPLIVTLADKFFVENSYFSVRKFLDFLGNTLTEDAQRIKVFQSLGANFSTPLHNKLVVLHTLRKSNEPNAAHYEQLFFNNLNKEGQTTYLKELVKTAQTANGEPNLDATNAADTLMTHLNTPYRVDSFKAIFDPDSNKELNSLVGATTQPSVAILKHYLETCCANPGGDKFTKENLDAILENDVRHNPPDKFKETTQKQLGHAIAQLVNPTQTELFVTHFEKLIPKGEGDQSNHKIHPIRLQTLIHLLDQPDGVTRGQKLVAELDKTNHESKQALVTLINKFPDESPYKAKLDKMKNPPAPPAAATSPAVTH